jgi:transposase
VPPPRKPYRSRPRPAIDQHAELVDVWLLADQQAPRKQRQIWQRLVTERGATCSEVTVSRYVAKRRMELGLNRIEVAVPQTHLPGVEAEVDFGEFWTHISGVLVKCWMFVMRLSCSGRAFHVAFTTQGQEAFLQGHVLAFNHFGGVPARIRCDNLKPAVSKVLKGRNRTESDRFVALRSHYGYDSFFCRPGKEGAHEKGGVEGDIGRFRRRHLVPVPDAGSLAQLNRLIAAGDLLDDNRVITGRPCTVAEAFAAELPTLQSLPADRVTPQRRTGGHQGYRRHPKGEQEPHRCGAGVCYRRAGADRNGQRPR